LSILIGLTSVVYLFMGLFLMFIVLIQKGEGGGLGGAFGGGAVDVAFGAKADLTWKKATASAALLFVVLTFVLGGMHRYQYRSVVAKTAKPAPAGAGMGSAAPLDEEKDAGSGTGESSGAGESSEAGAGKADDQTPPPDEGDPK